MHYETLCTAPPDSPVATVLAQVDTLAGTFGARAAEVDAQGEFAFDNFHALREAGLTALPIPLELGGAGFGLAEVCEVVRRIARGCPATALGYCMHLMTLGSFVEYWKLRRDSSSVVLVAIARGKLIVASAMSEGASAYFSPGSTISGDTAQLRLDGKKHICSLSPIADLFAVSARQGDQLVFTLVPRDSQGLRVNRTWDALGMRATGSHSVDFDGVPISGKAVFHKVPLGSVDAMVVSGLVWFQASLAAVYLGLAEGALLHAGEVLGRRLQGSPQAAGSRMVAQELGRQEQQRQLTEAAIARSVDTWIQRGPDTVALGAAIAAKNHIAAAGPDIVRSLMGLVGGQSYARTSLLARLLRDAQAAGFHQLHPHLANEVQGWRALGREVRSISGTEGVA